MRSAGEDSGTPPGSLEKLMQATWLQTLLCVPCSPEWCTRSAARQLCQVLEHRLPGLGTEIDSALHPVFRLYDPYRSRHDVHVPDVPLNELAGTTARVEQPENDGPIPCAIGGCEQTSYLSRREWCQLPGDNVPGIVGQSVPMIATQDVPGIVGQSVPVGWCISCQTSILSGKWTVPGRSHMSGRRKSAVDIRELLLHLRQYDSDRAVQRATGVHRGTVRRYRAWAVQQGLLTGALPTMGELEHLLQETLSPIRPPQNTSSVEPYGDLVKAIAQRRGGDDGCTGTPTRARLPGRLLFRTSLRTRSGIGRT